MFWFPKIQDNRSVLLPEDAESICLDDIEILAAKILLQYVVKLLLIIKASSHYKSPKLPHIKWVDDESNNQAGAGKYPEPDFLCSAAWFLRPFSTFFFSVLRCPGIHDTSLDGPRDAHIIFEGAIRHLFRSDRLAFPR